MMEVVFRVDASSRIGTGHVMRCLNLARGLQSKSAKTRFVCREQTGHLVPWLEEHGVVVSPLPAIADRAVELDAGHAGWLGTTQEEDALQTVNALAGSRPDWMVVDHYGIGREWERRLRPSVGRLMAIDDLTDRAHDCDLLLNQNFYGRHKDAYADLVPAKSTLLMGPRYALIAPEYSVLRAAMRKRDGRVRRILVFFGGSDPANATELALTGLSESTLRDVAVDVVIGSNYPHRQRLEAQLSRWPNAVVHRTLPHLANLMARADLALGAGGITTWERMCLGLPAIVVSIAENQRASCEELFRADAIEYLGDIGTVSAGDVQRAIERLASSADRLTMLTDRGRAMVDGLGVSRVIEALALQ
jgi:UDP-2,4-diacetamido-2,4,6-trideoxy-beta-L-altropyranose hydrolase